MNNPIAFRTKDGLLAIEDCSFNWRNSPMIERPVERQAPTFNANPGLLEPLKTRVYERTTDSWNRGIPIYQEI